MPGELEVGQDLAREWVVGEKHLYNPSGTPGHEVLSSPSMIWEMETACADLAKSHLPDYQTTVGFHVDVKHVAPAKPGALLTTTARLAEIAGKKLTFAVQVKDSGRIVGIGRHRRAVVNLADLG